jgi:RPAP1-like, C-terminal
LDNYNHIVSYLIYILSLSYVGSNPDSVAERDFLRTEGDPASIGYTINEAVSLTRSVVCMTSSLFDWCILF